MRKIEIDTLYKTVCIFLGVGMLLSYNLWIFERSYPVIPLISKISTPTINLFFLIFLLLSIIISVFNSSKRIFFIYSALLSLLFLIGIDLSRMQPWVYSYALILLSFAIHPSNKKALYQDIVLILALSYMWSGLQKMNISFIEEFFPNLIEPFIGSGSFVMALAIFSILFEVVGGVLLMTQRYRKVGIISMILIHISILLLIGPLGLNINSVVWPWNLCFILILIQLWNFDESLELVEIVKKKRIFQLAIILLLGIMPILSIVQLWPKYLSSALYSGNKIKSELYISDQFKTNLPESVQQAVNDTTNTISLLRWSLAELNVPDQPEAYLYEYVFNELCERTDNEFDLILILHSSPHIISGKREETSYFCDDSFYTQ